MKLDRTLKATMTLSSGVATTTSASSSTQNIPSKVAQVSDELLRSFPHSKRVGNYLLGRTLGEGSFAKVKEGLHTLTGEKVLHLSIAEQVVVLFLVVRSVVYLHHEVISGFFSEITATVHFTFYAE